MAFVDLASLFFVVGGTVLFSLAHIPFSDIKGAFKLAFAQGPIQRKDAQRPISVLSTIRILASASGVLGILVGVVKMLQNMDDPSAIGPAMAVALLTPMYAIIMAELLIGPAIGRLNARIDDDAPSAPPLKSSLVTTAAIPMVVPL